MTQRFVGRYIAIVMALASMAAAAAAQGGSITGKVTNAEGAGPIVGARVVAVAGLRTAAATISGEDGSFRLTGLANGAYAVVVNRIGFTARRFENIVVTGGGTVMVNVSMTAIATQLNQIVTTVSRGARPEKILDAPASIAVLNGEQIENRPAPTIANALRTMPGLSVSQGGLVQTNMVSRGFNNAFSGQMLMLQDYRFAGVPSLRVNVPLLFTGTTEDIDRVEVLNGPASALYGPNSANGVLHIITKSPFQSQGTTVTLDGGNQSLFRGAFRHAGTMDEHWGYKLSGEYFSATDFKYTDPNEPTTYTAGPGVPAGRVGQPATRDFNIRKYTGEARLDYRANADLENILSAGYTKAADALELTSVFGAAQVKNWSYADYQDRFRYKKFFAQVFLNTNNSGNKDASDLGGTYLLRTGIPIVDKSTVLVGQLQQAFDISKFNFVVGGDYILTKPRSEGTIFGRNEGHTDIKEYGAYLQGTLPLTAKLDLVTALRADQTDQMAGTQFSPRGALVYKPDAMNNFRFTFSRAFNSPQSFAYFLDLPQGSFPGISDFVARGVGNPPKDGWQFNRSCSGLCMHSPYINGGTTAVASNAAAAYVGQMAKLPQIIAASPLLSATQKQQLTALLPLLVNLQPTAAQVGSVYRALNANKTVTDTLNPTTFTDLPPLSPSFNNTWELGYKGIIGNRMRVAVDLWYQIRGDVAPAPATASNPWVFYSPTALGQFLGTGIAGELIAQGMPQAQAVATATAYAQAVTPFLAGIPVGTVAFTNPTLGNDPSTIFTYQNAQGTVDIHGVDLAIDYQLNDAWLLAATYSFQDKIVFPEIPGTLMSNSPKNRASGSTRYTNDQHGWTVESTVRFTDAFPVNSGVYTSNAPYAPVPSQTEWDLGGSWRLPVAQRVTWSLNASNVLDNKVPTFVGTPNIGRVLVTRLKYDF